MIRAADAPLKRRSLAVLARGVLFGSALFVTTFVAGCKDPNAGNSTGTGGSGGQGTASGATIKIGHFASLTGDTSTFGTATDNGMKLAVEEANAAGGVQGKQIELKTEDDQSKTDEARTVVTKLISQDGVMALLGEVSSSRSIAAAPVAQQSKVPMVSPSSTNPAVTLKGDYIFRVCFTDDFQAAVAAHFAWDEGMKTAAIFKDIKNEYSVGFADEFKKEYEKLGGKVVAEQSYQAGDADFKAQLSGFKTANPAVILVPGYYTEVGTIARQAREVGLTAPLLGGDGWDSPKLIPGAGNALENCYFTDHSFSVASTDPGTQKFVTAFKKKYNADPDALAALGYDAASILIEAMKSAKTLDGSGIRDALAGIKDFAGATGKITIDANRNARKQAVVMKIQGDKFDIFKTYTPDQIGK